MTAVIFHCPNVNLRVQGYTADYAAKDDAFVPVTCLACNRVHMVNPKTGKVLGADQDE